MMEPTRRPDASAGQDAGGATSGRTAGGGRRASLAGILARSFALVALVPFLPLAWLTWSGYRAEVARVEEEIQSSNGHIARLGASYLETFMASLRASASSARPGSAPELPPSLPGVTWELVDPGGRVLASGLDEGRVGSDCGYRRLLDRAGEKPLLSDIDRWLTALPPTVVLVRSLGRGPYLAGLVRPETLHAEMHTLSETSLDRHVYTVDRSGRLLFYSDLAVSRRGADLSHNPPIRLFVAGGQGELRYQSLVSGKERLGFVEPVSGYPWAVIVSADVGSALIGPRHRYLGLAWSIAFAVAMAVTIVIWVSRKLTRPVLDIVGALRDGERSIHSPLRVSPATRRVAEYDAMVQAFDDLTVRFAATEGELVQAERTVLLGQLASGLAHEMGTPLNVISGNAQYLLRKTAADDPRHAVLELIVKQARRIADMVRRVLDFSRPAEARLVPVPLDSLVEQTLAMVPNMTRDVTVDLSLEPGLPPALADPKLLEHALLNLIVNACQAMPDGGTLTLSTEPAPRDDSRLRVHVSDTGQGIPAEQLDRVFEPFFTTKAQGQGTGLGLAIVERIMRQHKGSVKIESAEGRGTSVTLELPAATAAPV